VLVVIFAQAALDDLPAWAANRTAAELPEIHEKGVMIQRPLRAFTGPPILIEHSAGDQFVRTER
jgi:hypothetical protein